MLAALSRPFASFARLADKIDDLADTADAANARLRGRLQLDPSAEATALEHRPAEAAGRQPTANAGAEPEAKRRQA